MDTIVTENVKPAALVTEFIKLRDEKKRFDEICAAKGVELYDNRMRDIEAKLLDLLNNLGVGRSPARMAPPTRRCRHR